MMPRWLRPWVALTIVVFLVATVAFICAFAIGLVGWRHARDHQAEAILVYDDVHFTLANDSCIIACANLPCSIAVPQQSSSRSCWKLTRPVVFFATTGNSGASIWVRNDSRTCFDATSDCLVTALAMNTDLAEKSTIYYYDPTDPGRSLRDHPDGIIETYYLMFSVLLIVSVGLCALGILETAMIVCLSRKSQLVVES